MNPKHSNNFNTKKINKFKMKQFFLIKKKEEDNQFIKSLIFPLFGNYNNNLVIPNYKTHKTKISNLK